MARIVVIGGGMVGLTLASRASSKGHDIVVLEAGAQQPGAGDLDTGGEVVTPGSYYDLATTRMSALSGTNWLWGGNSRWLETVDFEPLLKPGPNWLIERRALEPYFSDVEKLLLISGSWERNDYIEIEPPDGPFFEPSLYKLSPMIAPQDERRRGVLHEVWPESLKGVSILQEHLFTGLNLRGDRVVSVSCSHAGKRREIEGDYFFLAAGGIENCRQLLLLSAAGSRAVRHVSNALGTYWSEHPHPLCGDLMFADGKFFKLARGQRPPGLDFVSWIKYSLKDRSKIPGPPLSHTFQPVGHRRERLLASINEQLPLRENRITLSGSARDNNDLPLARLHYRVDTVSRQRIWDAIILFTSYLGAHESTRLRLNLPNDSFTDEKTFLGGGHHHMGGTCMGELQSGGVCDADCRLYGTENFAIAGSSVFPRGGSVNPTMNAIGLAFHSLDRMTG